MGMKSGGREIENRKDAFLGYSPLVYTSKLLIIQRGISPGSAFFYELYRSSELVAIFPGNRSSKWSNA
jgi:hypothetical protein